MTTPRVNALRRHLRTLGGLRAAEMPRRQVEVEARAVRDACLRLFGGMTPTERELSRVLVAAAVATKAQAAQR